MAFLIDQKPIAPDRLRDQLLEKPEFLADHPEILERVRQVLITRKLASRGSQRLALIQGKWKFLTHVAFTPGLGRSDAPEVLIEFTDYTCAPCRASASAVREAVLERKNLRVAILLLPLGDALAEYAARVALAAYRQDPQRFTELHHRLMEKQGPITQQSIIDAVTDLHFDVDQIERESSSAEIRRYFQQVRNFAEELEISGVPAFVLNDQLLLGGVTSAQLNKLIDSTAVPRTVAAAGTNPVQ